MEELRVVARDSGPRTCLYCRCPVEAPTVCDRCDATYHAECRAELGRCATPGCAGAAQRAPARPAFAGGWRESAAQAQAEWLATRIREEDERAAERARLQAQPRQPRVGTSDTRTPAAVAWGAAGLALLATLGVTVYGFTLPGAMVDQARLANVMGVLAGPPALAFALRALGARHPAARRGGWAMLATLVAAVVLTLRFDVWLHLPAFAAGLGGFASLVVGVLVGGDEPAS